MTDYARVISTGWPHLSGDRGWTMHGNDPATLVWDDPKDALSIKEIEAKAVELEPTFKAMDARLLAVREWMGSRTIDDLFVAYASGDAAELAKAQADADSIKEAHGLKPEDLVKRPAPPTKVQAAEAKIGQR